MMHSLWRDEAFVLFGAGLDEVQAHRILGERWRADDALGNEKGRLNAPTVADVIEWW